METVVTMYKVRVMGDEVTLAGDDTFMSLVEKYADRFDNPIILAKVNNDICELHKNPVEDCELEFLSITDPNGFRAYQRSLSFLMIYAAREVLGRETRVIIEHSINKNYYCKIQSDGIALTGELLGKIEDKMRQTAERDLPIKKLAIHIEEAIIHSNNLHLPDKVNILNYRRTSWINFYELDWFMNYFYGPMLPSTGYLNNFKLVLKEPGFILQFPSPAGDGELCKLIPKGKIFDVFQEALQWGRILNVETVCALNEKISDGALADVIRISEALHEKKIAEIADMITRENKKVVLIAGPSSSGKTTFSQRLSIQLRVNGLMPHIISLDDYFKSGEFVPTDEYGKPDYESFEYMDRDKLGADLTELLNGNTVHMPSFNFITGRPEYKGRYLTLNPEDVLILEGIHGLNEGLTETVPRSQKFKIFISALTQLNIDDHNRLATTDNRLIRRLVRDYRSRGMSAARTIAMWPSVQRGETKHIFPFQEGADALFNSSLVYEMCIIKQYVEPLLFKIDKSQPEYTEARRLIKFLDSFLGADSWDVPTNSILREFIGGSCFKT